MLSVYAGHAQLSRDLLARGADPNRANDKGQSIIAGAVFKSHEEIVHDLLKAGADPRLGSPTAIETAHMFGKKDLLGVLGAKEGDIGPNVPTPPSAIP
jgi:ankyrin repeat protein